MFESIGLGGFLDSLSNTEKFTFISLWIASIGAVVAIRKEQKERQLREREYVDKIRLSAGATITKLDKWKRIAMMFFEDIQPILIDANTFLSKSKDPTEVRDFLWREISKARVTLTHKFYEEQTQIGYSELYIYDPALVTLFDEAMDLIEKTINVTTYLVLKDMQNDIMDLWDQNNGKNEVRNISYNVLAESTFRHSESCKKYLMAISSAFQEEVIQLIKASDQQIFKKEITIKSPKLVLPPFSSFGDSMRNEVIIFK
jgi:hypothetical protein